jgi:prepilin-type N-terminal cleavage/methylation domain-containing protein
MKKKGFTLIELLAVIVILAIIALIVTPIVSNIIGSARKASNARSVEGHIKNIEYAVMQKTFLEGGAGATLYDGAVSDQEIRNLVDIPSGDNIYCSAIVIKGGSVVKAYGCKDSSWAEDNIFAYSEGQGAKDDTKCTYSDIAAIKDQAYTLISNKYGTAIKGHALGTPQASTEMSTLKSTYYYDDGTVDPATDLENNNWQYPNDPTHYFQTIISCTSTANEVFNAVDAWASGLGI